MIIKRQITFFISFLKKRQRQSKLQTIIIITGNPRVKRDEFYILLGLSISQGIIERSTLCSVACIKTMNILFQSQVFIDQKADPQEEVNITEGTFNSKKWIKLNFILCNVTNVGCNSPLKASVYCRDVKKKALNATFDKKRVNKVFLQAKWPN